MKNCKLFQLKIIFFLFPFILFPLEGGIKEQIAQEEAFLLKARSPEEKCEAFFHLACAYFEDQELDKAFLNFLQSLKYSPRHPPCSMTEPEKKLFTDAYRTYVDRSSSDPFKTAGELLEKYESQIKEHPDFLHMHFLLSTAYGNLGKYGLFFEHFFRGYPYLWDSYLAYKTQGILYLRLSQREKSLEGRVRLQKEAAQFLNLALQKEAKDASLYKILIALAKEEKNSSLILAYLQKMVREGVQIPRSDIFLYVKEAVALDEYELGQEMIDHGRCLYEVSRVLTAAQEYLDQHKNG